MKRQVGSKAARGSLNWVWPLVAAVVVFAIPLRVAESADIGDVFEDAELRSSARQFAERLSSGSEYPNVGLFGGSQPDISEPGPDSADLPDSAYAVPPGVVYVETSFSYTRSKGLPVRDYFTPTLVRIGVWEDFELRIASPGIIHESGADDSTTGFGPVTLGFKQNIWKEVEATGIPAFGVIAQVTVPTASSGFDDGTAIPTVFFNFDHTLPMNSYFEWNVGLSAVHDDAGERFTQGIFLWSLGHELTDDFTVFFHGAANVPASSGIQQDLLMGPGMIWFVSKRTALDFSYNFGVTEQSTHRLIRLGLSVAF